MAALNGYSHDGIPVETGVTLVVLRLVQKHKFHRPELRNSAGLTRLVHPNRCDLHHLGTNVGSERNTPQLEFQVGYSK